MRSSKIIEPIPVIVLSGFLGTGKTTVLNRLLLHATDSALIINEFGQTPIDQQLLKTHKIPMATLSGGCLCCQVRGALAPLLKNLRMAWESKAEKPFQRIFIETSGVASPEPILDTLLNERWLASRYDYRGMITTVSAALAQQYLPKYAEAQAQIAWANQLLITQTDLADAAQRTWLDNKLKEWAPKTPQLSVIRSAFDPAAVLDFNIANLHNMQPPSNELPAHPFKSISLHLDQPIAWQRLETVLQNLLDTYSSRIVRIKGVVLTQEHDEPMVVNAIAGHLLPPSPLPQRENIDNRGRLVFIADGDIETLAEIVMNALRQ